MKDVHRLCRAAVLAAQGELKEAEQLYSAHDPNPTDRAFNSARLWLARSFWHANSPHKGLKVLKRLSPGDSFAREHQAWFYLHLGDARRCDKQLQPFLLREDHRKGNNLSNFLCGISLILRGRDDEAMENFRSLDATTWPRTWTLGSHYVTNSLGGGSLRSYLRGSFLWERIALCQQITLLCFARGQKISSLPDEIKNCIRECPGKLLQDPRTRSR